LKIILSWLVVRTRSIYGIHPIVIICGSIEASLKS